MGWPPSPPRPPRTRPWGWSCEKPGSPALRGRRRTAPRHPLAEMRYARRRRKQADQIEQDPTTRCRAVTPTERRPGLLRAICLSPSPVCPTRQWSSAGLVVARRMYRLSELSPGLCRRAERQRRGGPPLALPAGRHPCPGSSPSGTAAGRSQLLCTCTTADSAAACAMRSITSLTWKPSSGLCRCGPPPAMARAISARP